MKGVYQLQPMALAISSALAFMGSPALAQVFDTDSAAVRQAYVGVATQEKKGAALVGLQQLLPQLRTLPGGGGGCTGGCAVIITQPSIPPFVSMPLITSTTTAANDGDLGVPGAPVTLDSTRLLAHASFSTPRNFLITPNGGEIHTNGFNLTLTGNLTANGTLLKDGLGTLVLTGGNVWNARPVVISGHIEGNTNSLQTSMFLADGVTVRFNQVVDGTYTGKLEAAFGLIARANFEKSGAGKLTLTNAQDHRGSATIAGGTLALQGAGSLGATSGLDISAGATFDISAATGTLPSIGALSGVGTIVLGSQQLSAGADANSVFGGSISGGGGLTKVGSGTLSLTGVNTYAGDTNINDGTFALAGSGRLNANTSVSVSGAILDLSNAVSHQTFGSVSGSGLILLGGNTLTVGGNNRDASFGGQISGSGGITKTGTGAWTLSGANTYTGITTIEHGNLIAQTQSISDRVINNASLTLTEKRDLFSPFLSAYSGNISGTGRLVKDGDGFIWLRGRNTYTGGTEVREGALIGNTDSLQGNITNNAALAFYQADNGTYAGTLSGSGTLLQYGPGVLTLTGNNTYTGGTAASGTLRIDRDANLGAASGPLILAGGTLQIGANVTTERAIIFAGGGGTIDTNGFNLSTGTAVPAGSVNSSGGLTKIGAGTLTFNRIETHASTAVQAGRLEVNSWLTSNVTVAAGAELGGTGAIVGKVVNNGRLALGNAIGEIKVVGDVTFNPGSVYTVRADAAGNSDRLLLPNPLRVAFPVPSDASARAILKGGTVDVRAENGNYKRETRYNIVSADGGVSGQFAGVTSNLAFLNPSLAYDTNNVYLSLTRNDLDYAAVAQTANQTAVARGLTRMTGAAGGDAATVTAVLDGLSAPQARAAFDSIGAAGRASLPQVGSLNQRSVNQNLIARLGLAEGGNTLAPVAGIAGRAVQVAFDDSTRSDAAPVYAQAGLPAGGQGLRGAGAEPGNGLWLRGYGGTGRIDGDANAPGAKYHYGGTLFGYDRKIGNEVTLGVFGGYAEPRYAQDVATSSARAKTVQVGGYGRLHSGAWHLDAVASYARNDTDTSRVVTVGTLNRAASGSFTGDTVSVHVEAGYTLKPGAYELQPLAALSWVRQTQDAYGETGAGALNLVLPKQSQESLRSTLGLRSLHPFQAGATQAVFEARAAWSHEFDNTRSVNARLAGDPAAAVFTVSGPALPRDSAIVGVGIAAQASRNLRLYADVNGEFNGRVRAGALSMGLRYQW